MTRRLLSVRSETLNPWDLDFHFTGRVERRSNFDSQAAAHFFIQFLHYCAGVAQAQLFHPLRRNFHFWR